MAGAFCWIAGETAAWPALKAGTAIATVPGARRTAAPAGRSRREELFFNHIVISDQGPAGRETGGPKRQKTDTMANCATKKQRNDGPLTAPPLRGALLLGTWLLSPLAAVGADQPLESIRGQAEAFARSQFRAEAPAPEVRAGRLDPRLKLSRCDRPLEAFLPQGGRRTGNIRVGIRCPGSRPWSIYVPVNVRVFDQVLVAGRALARGQALRPKDLQTARREVTRLRQGYLRPGDSVTGLVARRPIPAGAVLTPEQLRPPRLVRQGDDVVILARTGNLMVRMMGKALMDGAAGDRVRVRNHSTKKVIHGIVTAKGVVRVNL